MSKIPIRFYNDHEVLAAWNEEHDKWFFAIVDVVAAITQSEAPRKYWSMLKTRSRRQENELATNCSQLKLLVADDKHYITDCIAMSKVAELVKVIPSKATMNFLDRLMNAGNTLDEQNIQKAYQLFESGILATLEPGCIKCLQQIHAYLFGWLYAFARQLRTLDISKGCFTFANCHYFPMIFGNIEHMPENTLNEIVSKYIDCQYASLAFRFCLVTITLTVNFASL